MFDMRIRVYRSLHMSYLYGQFIGMRRFCIGFMPQYKTMLLGAASLLLCCSAQLVVVQIIFLNDEVVIEKHSPRSLIFNICKSFQ